MGEKIREQAFSLYALGKSLRDIENDLKIKDGTIKSWRKRLNWDQRKSEIQNKSHKDFDESLIEMKSKLIKMIYEAIEKGF